MTMSYKLTAAYFDSKGLKYMGHEEDDALLLFYGMESGNRLDILIHFDESETSAGLTTYNYVKFPAEKKADMYALCSKMNEEYRWVKFFVDEETCEIKVRDDAVIQLDSCGEEMYELTGRMIQICESAYKDFMKGVWG